jgi:hypothetical protein
MHLACTNHKRELTQTTYLTKSQPNMLTEKKEKEKKGERERERQSHACPNAQGYTKDVRNPDAAFTACLINQPTFIQFRNAHNTQHRAFVVRHLPIPSLVVLTVVLTVVLVFVVMGVRCRSCTSAAPNRQHNQKSIRKMVMIIMIIINATGQSQQKLYLKLEPHAQLHLSPVDDLIHMNTNTNTNIQQITTRNQCTRTKVGCRWPRTRHMHQ